MLVGVLSAVLIPDGIRNRSQSNSLSEMLYWFSLIFIITRIAVIAINTGSRSLGKKVHPHNCLQSRAKSRKNARKIKENRKNSSLQFYKIFTQFIEFNV